ncbi:ATPase domain-containing protein [Dictyobacter alpinus]|nr:ATPase domain-containing protein [Dictyobacter alpinus]
MTEISHDIARIERVPSGIEGFDQILQGGLLKGETYLIMGAPGAGKTIFGNQMCFNHVAAGGRAIYMTVLAETHSRMLSHMQSFDFFSQEPIADKLIYLSGYATLEQQGLDALLTMIRKEVRRQHATLLVIDGMVTIEQNASTLSERKEFLHSLSVITEAIGCTTVLLMQYEKDMYDQPEHTMVDGLFRLSSHFNDSRWMREFQVYKFRGSSFMEGRHLYAISGKGIELHPRIDALLKSQQVPLPPSLTSLAPPERLGFGVTRLDEMVRGGIPLGNSTIVLGAPGTGKTLLGLHFLYEGAKQGEQCLHFGFYESTSQLKQRMVKMGLDMEDPVVNQHLEFMTQPPTEDIIDVLGKQILETVRRKKVRRLFIDGIAGFQNTVASTDRLVLFLTSLFTSLRNMDITTIWSIELADLLSPTLVMPESISKIAILVENILFLRYVELYSQLYRLISIIKMRQSGYDPSIREFRITDQGLNIAATFDSAEAILTGAARPRETDSESGFTKDTSSSREKHQ